MPSATLSLGSSPYKYNVNIPRPQLPFAYENSIANAPRDDSFASYLAVVRENFTPAEFPITPTRRRAPTPLHMINLTRKRSDDDTEIDIFAAEKYFNGSPNPDADPTTTLVHKTPPKPTSPYSAATLSKSHSLTWTLAGSSCGASSQPTTVNSRDVLLRDRRRRRAPVGCGGGGGRSVFHLGGLGNYFWCSSCSRKHAVNVDKAKEAAAGIITSTGTATGGDHNFVAQKQSASPRSPASWRIEASQRRRRPNQPPTPTKFVVKEEDDRSESSSDLFEIESVAMSRAGYEPSEASIAWSVVTASAANVSVVSDRIGEMGGKGRRKTAGGLLLAGCASHKAVEVSPKAAAAAAEMESSISPVVARYHVDLEAGGGSGRIVAGRANGTSWHGGSGRIVL